MPIVRWLGGEALNHLTTQLPNTPPRQAFLFSQRVMYSSTQKPQFTPLFQ
jgi:hypothetical protein